MTLQALQNMKRHSIYFSSPKEFNDPYDCAVLAPVAEPTREVIDEFRSSTLSDPEVPEGLKSAMRRIPDPALADQLRRGSQAAADQQRNRFLATRGVACFSIVLDNLLMWSHYADGCRGFCLEFRTEFEPFNNIRPVVYSEQLPILGAGDMLSEEDDDDAVLKAFRWKSQLWAYEEEWRAFHAEAGTLFTYKPEALKAIYFGPNIEGHDLDLICLILAGQNPDVETYLGSRSPDEYKVEFRNFDYTTLVEARRLGIVDDG